MSGVVRVTVAVDTPQHAGLGSLLDYTHTTPLAPGTLVRVPLGKRELTGVAWHRADGPAPSDAQLRPLTEVMDALTPLPAAWRQLVEFSAGYYQRSVGEVAMSVLPPELRKLGAAAVARRVTNDVLRWLLWDNHKLTSYTATLRFLMALSKDPNPAVVETFRARALTAIKVLDTQLTGREWVALDKPSIADLSLCGYLWFNEEFGVDWKTYPAVGAWLRRLEALPGWKHPYALMPGHPLPAKG